MATAKPIKKILCFTCLFLVSCVSPAMSEPLPHDFFQGILPALQHKTQVPIVLPVSIHYTDSSIGLYAVVETATPEQYVIILGATPDCNGGNACRWGTLSGEAITPITPPPEAESDFLNDSHPKPVLLEPPGFLSLAKNKTGYFVPSVCGAFCSDSQLFWEQNGYRYMVGIKAGKLKELVLMANSAINHSN